MTDIRNQKILLIELWIGKIPDYYQYHLESMMYQNNNIDIYFFTDQDINYEITNKNYHVVKTDIEEIKRRFLVSNGIELNLHNDNKKITDLKFSYFVDMFSDIINYHNYDYFGIYDIDTIFGNIYDWVKPYLGKKKFISIGGGTNAHRLSGPLILFKNDEEILNLFKTEKYYSIFETQEIYGFGELDLDDYAKSIDSVEIIQKSQNCIHETSKILYEMIFENGFVKCNNENILCFHFFDKKNTIFKRIGNKIISRHNKHLEDDFYYVTYFSENYQTLVENLLDSLRKYSNRKLIAYTINYDVSQEFLDKWGGDQFIFIRYDIEEGHKDERGRDFNILSLKPKICLNTLKKYKDCKFVYLDTDVYATVNIDNVRYYFESLEDYPLFNSHIHDSIMVSNERTGWEWKNPMDLLLQELNIENNPVLPRKKANFFIFDKNSEWFIQEQVEIFEKLYNEDKLSVLFLHDEDIANALIYKYQKQNSLPLLDMEEFYDLNFSNLENYSYHMTHYSHYVKLPKTVDDFLIFHGYKEQDDYEKIKNNYGNSVLDTQDFIIIYENNTLFFRKNNFLNNKKIKNTVNFDLYDENLNLIFSLQNQEIYNYWTFYISNIFVRHSKLNIKVTETDTNRTIYQNTIQL